MGWFFDEAINTWLQNAIPWMEWPLRIITYFGESIFYIVLLAMAFWVYKKKDAIIAIYVLLTASFLNFFLKVLIKKPRPTISDNIIEEEGFSTPSGHAQTSTTMYGWIMFHFKKIWLYIVTPILVLLICLSRVFLGVHFIGDVILGFLIGGAVLAALYFGIPPLIGWMDKWPTWVKIVAGEGYGLLVFVLTFFTGLFADWPEGDAKNSAQTVAALLIFPLIIWVEDKYIKMDNEDLKISSVILRIIVGLAFVAGSYFGFDVLFGLFETSNYALDYLYDFIQYTIVLSVLGLLMPLIFSRIKIFTQKKELITQEQSIETTAA